ncbi:hypothetical protein [Halomicrobium katesii]|nr:hypothetical protein [Halomicrobium katesii]
MIDPETGPDGERRVELFVRSLAPETVLEAANRLSEAAIDEA